MKSVYSAVRTGALNKAESGLRFVFKGLTAFGYQRRNAFGKPFREKRKFVFLK